MEPRCCEIYKMDHLFGEVLVLDPLFFIKQDVKKKKGISGKAGKMHRLQNTHFPLTGI